MRFNLDITGFSEVMECFADLPNKANASIARTSNFVAQSTVQRVKDKIRSGARSGHIYSFGGVPHQASAPGEPPADLSGVLAESYRWTRMTDRPGSSASAGSNLDYATLLEFGGINDRGQFVAARPVLFPAFLEAMAQAELVLKKEFEATP